MKVMSRGQRDGEPLICAYGCRLFDDGAMRAGLLFVREALPPGPVELIDAATLKPLPHLLLLPTGYTDADFDVWGINEVLEVYL